MMFAGAVGALISPFWPLLLYYTLATLRPQQAWAWSLADWPDLRWSLVAAVLLIGAVGLHFGRVLDKAKANPVLILICLYGLFVGLSVLSAINPAVAEFWAIEHAKLLLVFVLGSLIVQRFAQLRILAIMIAVCLGYHGLSVNRLYFFDAGRLDVFHEGILGLDNNGAGSLMVVGLPFMAWMATRTWSRGQTAMRLVGAGLLVLTAHAVMMTYSRGAMLAGLVGLVWLALHHRPRHHAAAFVIAGILIGGVLAGPDIRDRFMSVKQFEKDESAQLRFASWSAAWDMSWDYPLLGKGVRNSNGFSGNYGADRSGRTTHNQYLQIAADSGWPAALCYIAAFGVAVIGLTRCRQRCLAHLRDLEDDENSADPHSGLSPVHAAVKMPDHVADHEPDARDTTPPQQALARRRDLKDAAGLCLAVQTALLSFTVSCMVLSMEAVEIPYLLLVMAGVMPIVLRETLFDRPTETDGNTLGLSPLPDLVPTPSRRSVPPYTGVPG